MENTSDLNHRRIRSTSDAVVRCTYPLTFSMWVQSIKFRKERVKKGDLVYYSWTADNKTGVSQTVRVKEPLKVVWSKPDAVVLLIKIKGVLGDRRSFGDKNMEILIRRKSESKSSTNIAEDMIIGKLTFDMMDYVSIHPDNCEWEVHDLQLALDGEMGKKRQYVKVSLESKRQYGSTHLIIHEEKSSLSPTKIDSDIPSSPKAFLKRSSGQLNTKIQNPEDIKEPQPPASPYSNKDNSQNNHVEQNEKIENISLSQSSSEDNEPNEDPMVDIKKLKSKNASLANRNKKVLDDYMRLKNENANIHNQIKKLMKEQSDSNERVLKLEEQISTLQDQKFLQDVEKDKQKDKYENKLEALVSKSRMLETKLSEANQKIDSLSEDKKELENKNTKLQMSANTFQAKYNQASNHIQALEKEILTLKKVGQGNHNVDVSLSSTKDSINNTEISFADLTESQKKIVDLGLQEITPAQFQSMRQLLNELMMQTIAAKFDNDLLIDENQNLRNQQYKHQEKMNILQSKLNTLSTSNELRKTT